MSDVDVIAAAVPEAAKVEAVDYVDLRDTRGNTTRVYDPDVVVFIQEGPPTVVVGVATCVLGLHTGAAFRVGMSADAVLDALGCDSACCVRFTDPGSGLVYHVLKPERIQIVSGEKGSTIVLRDFGVLLVRESPREVMKAVEDWALMMKAKGTSK